MPSANVMPREAYGTNEPSEMLKQVQHDRIEGEDHVSQPAGCDLQDDEKEEGFTSRTICFEIVLIFPFISFPLDGERLG